MLICLSTIKMKTNKAVEIWSLSSGDQWFLMWTRGFQQLLTHSASASISATKSLFNRLTKLTKRTAPFHSIPDISLMISKKNPQIYHNIFFILYLTSISANCFSLRCICFWFVVVLCAPLDLRSEGRINQLLKVLRFVYLTQTVAWRRCRVLIQTNYMCLLGESDVM